MSYYESRIKALEEKVAEMAKRERMKAIPVEAQLIDSIAKLKTDLHNCYTAIRVKDEENARLKADVERLRKAGDWLPIETAPKDMSQVLGYVEESIVVMWWFTYSNGRACWETVDGESEVDPTHWMPLPKPPKEGKPSA